MSRKKTLVDSKKILGYEIEKNRMYVDLLSFDFLSSMSRFNKILEIFYSSKNLTNLHVTICIDLTHFEIDTNRFRVFTDLIDRYFQDYIKDNPTKYKKVILHPWIQFYRPNQNPFISFRKIFFRPGSKNRKECKYILIQGESKLRRVHKMLQENTIMLLIEGRKELYVQRKLTSAQGKLEFF